MTACFQRAKKTLAYRILSAFIAFTFSFSYIVPPGYAQGLPATVMNLPVPGTTVPLTPGFTPARIIGMTIHADNPLMFDFMVDPGDAKLNDQQMQDESLKLVKYFLASLTVPAENLWVNLSPYEKDKIVPKEFGQTQMGVELLAQDYMLKQLTASLMNPEDELGKKFWDRVYAKAQKMFGTTEIPLNTFNKVWIVPEKAVVYVTTSPVPKGEEESQSSERIGANGLNVFVLESRFKVMMEEDYLALQHHSAESAGSKSDVVSGVSSSIIKEVLLPEIEKEVNEGKTFANLRQIHNSLILATWYKQNLKESLLGKIYLDKGKTGGLTVADKETSQKIYDQYVAAFQKGVHNFIKEDYDPVTKEIIPRKYFSGGVTEANLEVTGTKSPGSKVLQTFAKESADASIISAGIESPGSEVSYKMPFAKVTPPASGEEVSSPVTISEWIGKTLAFPKSSEDNNQLPDILRRAENTKRSYVIGGNLKMNLTPLATEKLIRDMAAKIKNVVATNQTSWQALENMDIVIAPSYTSLSTARETINDVVREGFIPGGLFQLGAQNVSGEKPGAQTGEESVENLKELGVSYVILGHSERRHGPMQESSGLVNRKAKRAIEGGLTPIIAIGETLEEYQNNFTYPVIRDQFYESINNIDLKKIVVAYEPVWAIGTGLTPTPEEANLVHRFIRALAIEQGGLGAGVSLPVQYGGSMNSKNVDSFIAQSSIDGGLIGGASLKAEDFIEIVIKSLGHYLSTSSPVLAEEIQTQLRETAAKMVPLAGGILAADESTGSAKARLDLVGLENTPENREKMRQLMLTTPGLVQAGINAVILYSETFDNSDGRGGNLTEYLLSQGILPGIKTDGGLIDDPESAGEKIPDPKGLAKLLEMLTKFKAKGAVFTKWRTTQAIDSVKGLPTKANIRKNAIVQAQEARMTQEAGLVPIVEPEVLLDGTHDIAASYRATTRTLELTFEELVKEGVWLPGMILKTSMILSGNKATNRADSEMVGFETIKGLLKTVPAQVPAIVFLSGGQKDDEVVKNLDAVIRVSQTRFEEARDAAAEELIREGKIERAEELISLTKAPWEISYSFGRGLQRPALVAWAGKDENFAAAQEVMRKTSEATQAARLGESSSPVTLGEAKKKRLLQLVKNWNRSLSERKDILRTLIESDVSYKEIVNANPKDSAKILQDMESVLSELIGSEKRLLEKLAPTVTRSVRKSYTGGYWDMSYPSLGSQWVTAPNFYTEDETFPNPEYTAKKELIIKLEIQYRLATLESIINKKREVTGLKKIEINTETPFNKEVVVNPRMKEEVLREFAGKLGIEEPSPDVIGKIMTMADAVALASSPVKMVMLRNGNKVSKDLVTLVMAFLEDFKDIDYPHVLEEIYDISNRNSLTDELSHEVMRALKKKGGYRFLFNRAWGVDYDVRKIVVAALNRGQDGKFTIKNPVVYEIRRSDFASSPIGSRAEPAQKGGIDLNPGNMDLQTNYGGERIQLPMPNIPLENIKIDGLVPIIIHVAPVVNLPLLLGLSRETETDDTAVSRPQHSPVDAPRRFKAREVKEVGLLN